MSLNATPGISFALRAVKCAKARGGGVDVLVELLDKKAAKKKSQETKMKGYRVKVEFE